MKYVIVAPLLFAMVFAIGFRVGEVCDHERHQGQWSVAKFPVTSIDGLPDDHASVEKDADGYFWVEPLTLAKWSSCGKCHGNRWSQTSGRRCGHRLEWYESGKTVLYPENPKGK